MTVIFKDIDDFFYISFLSNCLHLNIIQNLIRRLSLRKNCQFFLIFDIFLWKSFHNQTSLLLLSDVYRERSIDLLTNFYKFELSNVQSSLLKLFWHQFSSKYLISCNTYLSQYLSFWLIQKYKYSLSIICAILLSFFLFVF